MSESSESLPTNDAPADEPANEPVSASDKLKALFGEEGESQSKDDAGESRQNAESKGEPKGKPKALKDLAERLNATPEDLYAIEVPMGGEGKTMTLGALKDLASKQDDFTVRELEFSERVSKTEAEWTRQQQEMQALISSLDPKAVTPEVRERMRGKVEAELKRERVLTLQTIPEWQNETVRNAELASMVEYLRDFGIPDSFLLSGASHKLFRMVRDATLRKQRFEKAMANIKEVKKPSTTGRSSAGNGAPRKHQTQRNEARQGTRERLLSVLN